MRVPVQLKLQPSPKTTHDNISAREKNWWQSLQQNWQLVSKTVNSNIEFGNPTSGPGNIKGQWGSVAGSTTITTPAPGVDFTVIHNLGYPAVGVDIKSKNAAVDVFTSPSANASPNTQIILRATAGGVVITLFVH